MRSHRSTQASFQVHKDSHTGFTTAHTRKSMQLENGPMRRNNKIIRAITLSGVLAIAGLMAACSNQTQSSNPFGPGAGLAQNGPVKAGTPRDFSVNVGSTVYFTVDSSQLTPDAMATLSAQAQWLKRYPQFTITVAGHADERGTRDYNLALGGQRAEAVRRFLSTQGINPTRMRTISYGKERPVALCNDISCWSQNRRSETVLNQRVGS